MKNKLKIWDGNSSWEEAEKHWDEGAEIASKELKLKSLAKMPSMPGITEKASKNLKWKSLKWMILKDHNRKILKGFLKHPLKYGFSYLKSLFRSKSYVREDDFFLYGLSSLAEFERLLETPNTLFVAGFSYCHKPFECPSGRFTSECIHDPQHPVCRQCFIGKAINALPEKGAVPLLIPTVHYIGGKIFELVHRHPDKQIIFLITACEMTLEMFGDWGNMVGIRGIGVRLDGRICNTMKAFQLSEEGTKPGLTVVLEGTKKRLLDLIKRRRETFI